VVGGGGGLPSVWDDPGIPPFLPFLSSESGMKIKEGGEKGPEYRSWCV
jgi:hypothetical protein